MAMMGRSQGPGLRLTPAVGFSCSCYYDGICLKVSLNGDHRNIHS